ncbi:MAG: MAPEG family protein [Rhizobiaceae bacterium]
MESMIESLPLLTPYQPSFIWLLVLCLVVLVQSFLAGILGFASGDEVPGLPLKGSHGDKSFRVLRTYANSTENFSIFVSTTILAILAGVDVMIVNWLVGLHVALRIVYCVVYYSGVGKVAGGPRTFTYVAAFLMNVILAVVTAYTMLT